MNQKAIDELAKELIEPTGSSGPMQAIPPIPAELKTKILEVLDMLIAANSGRLFVVIALTAVRIAINALPTA